MRRAILSVLACLALLASACPGEWSDRSTEKIERITITTPAPTTDPAQIAARAANFAPTTPDPTPSPRPVVSRPAPSYMQRAASEPTLRTHGDVWAALARCESGGNAATNTGNGYYGAFQFSASTWRSIGGSGLPHQHPYETQRYYAIRLQARSGWGQWPDCSRKLGLR